MRSRWRRALPCAYGRFSRRWRLQKHLHCTAWHALFTRCTPLVACRTRTAATRTHRYGSRHHRSFRCRHAWTAGRTDSVIGFGEFHHLLLLARSLLGLNTVSSFGFGARAPSGLLGRTARAARWWEFDLDRWNQPIPTCRLRVPGISGCCWFYHAHSPGITRRICSRGRTARNLVGRTPVLLSTCRPSLRCSVPAATYHTPTVAAFSGHKLFLRCSFRFRIPTCI